MKNLLLTPLLFVSIVALAGCSNDPTHNSKENKVRTFSKYFSNESKYGPKLEKYLLANKKEIFKRIRESFDQRGWETTAEKAAKFEKIIYQQEESTIERAMDLREEECRLMREWMQAIRKQFKGESDIVAVAQKVEDEWCFGKIYPYNPFDLLAALFDKIEDVSKYAAAWQISSDSEKISKEFKKLFVQEIVESIDNKICIYVHYFKNDPKQYAKFRIEPFPISV